MLLSDGAHRVRIDTSHLEQVVLNLSVNARDAMPEGGSLLIETSEHEFGAETSTVPRPGRYVGLSVTDTGTGFTEEARQHVFEPFFTTKPDSSGTGLGLATVYGILAEAGGNIRIYSEPGTGTTLTITMPVTAETAVPIAEPAPFQRTPKRETVLVVEDEAALRAGSTPAWPSWRSRSARPTCWPWPGRYSTATSRDTSPPRKPLPDPATRIPSRPRRRRGRCRGC
jgi:hypothetical protein